MKIDYKIHLSDGRILDALPKMGFIVRNGLCTYDTKEYYWCPVEELKIGREVVEVLYGGKPNLFAGWVYTTIIKIEEVANSEI